MTDLAYNLNTLWMVMSVCATFVATMIAIFLGAVIASSVAPFSPSDSFAEEDAAEARYAHGQRLLACARWARAEKMRQADIAMSAAYGSTRPTRPTRVVATVDDDDRTVPMAVPCFQAPILRVGGERHDDDQNQRRRTYLDGRKWAGAPSCPKRLVFRGEEPGIPALPSPLARLEGSVQGREHPQQGGGVDSVR